MLLAVKLLALKVINRTLPHKSCSHFYSVSNEFNSDLQKNFNSLMLEVPELYQSCCLVPNLSVQENLLVYLVAAPCCVKDNAIGQCGLRCTQRF